MSFRRVKRFFTKKRYCRVDIDPNVASMIIENIYNSDDNKYNKTNPIHSQISKNDFEEIMKKVVRVQKIVKQNKEKTPKKMLKKLEKVTQSITRCPSASIFDPTTSIEEESSVQEPSVQEPTIDEIIDSNGKAYLLWRQSQLSSKSGGRKLSTKKRRRSIRK